MTTVRERLRGASAGLGTAMYTGALVFVAGRLLAKGELAHPLGLALLGALYALAVLGLMRVFGARRWGLAVAGVLCGPTPVALLAGTDSSGEDRGGMLFVGALFGLVVGLMEWNRQSRLARGDAA
ncbi:MAG: hypothetical protein K8S98_03580 [Planctomycetes bacterium]|nr:hypothetical protein [Planctomycetota bacterium]